MNCHHKIVSIFIFFFIASSDNFIIASSDAVTHHVICSLRQAPKNKAERRRYNHLIHQATHEIKKQCKIKYKNSIDHNKHYPHRKDSVFFIHFDHAFNSWTLYKPSFIS